MLWGGLDTEEDIDADNDDRSERFLFASDVVELRGLNWFGFEGKGAIIDGLWENTINHYLGVMKEMGVNAIRIPLAVDNVLKTLSRPSAWRDERASQAATSLDALDLLIRQAASYNILILLDMHRLVGSIWPDPQGLWYSPLVSEAYLHAAWRKVARRYCNERNVFGADLLNDRMEPSARRRRQTRF